MRHNPFPKIGQFRQVIKEVIHRARYAGTDEETGEPIYNTDAELPLISVVGTTKLHGTNAGVTFDLDNNEFYIQSRNNCYNTIGTHMDFGDFVFGKNKEYFEAILRILAAQHKMNSGLLTIFGEWAGTSIQKGVAISELPKAFYMFAVKHKCGDDTRWLPCPVPQPDNGIYRMRDFGEFEVAIDFANPKLSQNTLVSITDAVEECCPVSKQLGKEGIGEGVVYHFDYKGKRFWFKVKGQKHSESKVKTTAPVDTEKLKSVMDFADYAATEQRVIQAMQEVGAESRKDTGDVLRWIANDIMAEEIDTLVDNGLEWKDVAKDVATRARIIFFNKLDEDI